MPLNREQARAEIQHLIERYHDMTDDERSQITEASVVQQFIEPLLEALGWPLREPKRYKKELSTAAGRPDLTLEPESGGTIFLEAKRFGAIQELKEARTTISGIVTPGQLALPGMATDRTAQEQQAINYAFENNATWAILTNFEKLRLFNARRDWLVLSFERPNAYLEDFDTLWQLSYENILNGELDRLSDQRYREDVDTDYLGFIHDYRERLAKDVIAHPGANRWAFVEESDRVNLPLLRDVVQRFLDRLVVVRFAEDHFVLKPGTLKQKIEANLEESYGVRYGFTLNEVIRRFFRNFDDIHNSALFAFDPILDERAEFDEGLVAGLIDKLYEARYRAMPPDIMGNTYEQYLGTTLVQVDGQVETRSNLETRKKQGSYYTPQVIVRYLVDNSLGRYLYGTADGKPDGEPVEGERQKSPAEIENLRVLDPACGSGSFLIYAYEVLAGFYRAEIARLTAEKEATIARRSAELGSPLEAIGEANAAYDALIDPLKDYPRFILERHLYGVDLDPQAAELAAVNLIFRAMDDQRRMGSRRKLPLILNQNVKCGNALIGRTSPQTSPPGPLSTGGEGESEEGESGQGEERTGWYTPSHLWKKIKPLARQMRREPTEAEDMLWQALRNRQVADAKFRRQYTIGQFIVDFYCAESRLVVEVDGPIHDYTPEEDAIRQAFIEANGLTVLRFTNDEVLYDLDGVVERIGEAVTSPPSPLSTGGEGESDRREGGGGVWNEVLLLRRLRAKLAENSHDGEIQATIDEAAGEANARLNADLAGHFEDAAERRPFNWGVEFPEAFVDAEGRPLGDEAGFDVIVGNPPWEIVKPDLREYYAQFDPDIESRLNRKQAEKRIKELSAEDPLIGMGWKAQKARVEKDAAFYRTDAAGFSRQGRGDTATHKLFLERAWGLLKDQGRLGYVVPSGIYTDLGTKELREMMLHEGDIDYLYSFSNERFFFPGVHHSFKFTLLGAQKGGQGDGFWAAFRFNPRVAVSPDELSAFLANPDNLVYVRQESLKRFSPDSLSLMEFQTQQDYEVTERIYSDRPLLGEQMDNPWNVRLNREFDIANDRALLNSNGDGYPFYEGKMIHQFDAFYAEPQFWISNEKTVELPEDKQQQLKTYRVTHRRIARTTDERTLISAIVPPNSACENNATVVLLENTSDESVKPYLCALLNSFVLDYVIRYKVATTLNMFYLYQLPLLRLSPGNPYFDAIVPRAARLTCTTDAFADLWGEVMGEPWDESKGATDPAERQRLRDEIDALVAHLYGLSRDDFAHILGTFPLVFPDDGAGQAKKEALLATYDRFAPETEGWPRG